MKTILTVIGTRPEAIKLAPVLVALSKSKYFISKVCITGQHTDLLNPFLFDLGIIADYQFSNNQNNGSLYQSAASILEKFGTVLSTTRPDLVIVQGDTTTAFAAAIAAFYSRIPLAHIEAGLRTGNLNSPWPEEAHRYFIDRVSSYFFAPTQRAKERLFTEGIPIEKIWVVGNTSIDAIREFSKPIKSISNRKKTIVVTVHRRENHGARLKEICYALKAIVEQFLDVRIMFILHPNPSIRNSVIEILAEIANIDLIEPLDHPSLVELLAQSDFIITDSGGIQEEAPFIGKPVVIIRDTTERPEGVEAGTARLVGTKADDIIKCCKELLESDELLASMSKIHFPYGNGFAANHVVKILEEKFAEVVFK
jgi:UDP-N-acetylglucosamine 2-epimerase (non-hydrolysing)